MSKLAQVVVGETASDKLKEAQFDSSSRRNYLRLSGKVTDTRPRPKQLKVSRFTAHFPTTSLTINQHFNLHQFHRSRTPLK